MSVYLTSLFLFSSDFKLQRSISRRPKVCLSIWHSYRYFHQIFNCKEASLDVQKCVCLYLSEKLNFDFQNQSWNLCILLLDTVTWLNIEENWTFNWFDWTDLYFKACFFIFGVIDYFMVQLFLFNKIQQERTKLN